jgi:glutathione S-transferase
MTPSILLWGVGTSRTIRPHWALHELGLKYEMRPIQPRTGETKTAEFTALSPRQKIPLLQDDELTMGESAAIVAYLARRYGTNENSLMPQDPMGYAKWLEWCFFIVTELDSTSLYVMRRHGTVKGLAHIYGHAPEVVRQAGEYFRGQLRNVDVALRDGRTYLMGDQFTTADILLSTCLTWAIDYGVGICDSAVPYLERTTARRAYTAAVRTNTPIETVIAAGSTQAMVPVQDVR